MHPNRTVLAAGLLASFTAAVHMVAGTLQIQGPLLGSSIAEPERLLLYACWHLVTAALVLSAGALLWGARAHDPSHARPLVRWVSALWMLFGAVFLAVALGFAGPRGLLVLPQWMLLFPVGALGWLGSRPATLSSALRRSVAP